jgi:hypothetical protein
VKLHHPPGGAIEMPTEVHAETANRVLEDARKRDIRLAPVNESMSKNRTQAKTHWQVAGMASMSIGFS